MMGPHHRRAGARHPSGRRAVVFALLGTMSCAGGDGARPVAGEDLDVLPRLQEMPIPVRELSPGSVESPIVAGPDGSWLYAPGDLQRSALVVVDSSGREERALGSYGEGPGEMRASFPLWLDDTIAIGHDLATRRLMVWNRDGTLRREFRATRPVIPLGRGPGNTLLARRFRGETEVPTLIDLASGMVTDMIPPDDSVLPGLFRDDRTLSERVSNSPAVGRWRDGVVVANGMTYTMGLWRSDGEFRGVLGRDLPPARSGAMAIERELQRLGMSPMARNPEQLDRLRSELAATPVQRFSHFGAPRTDGRGRLWVIVQEGDSVNADVFSAERYLGRLPLDCPGFGGRWDLAGDWLFLVCEPKDPASILDAEVRRHRIVEGRP